MRPSRWLFPLFALLSLLSIIVTGCSGDNSQSDNGRIQMAPLTNMPAEVQDAPVSVQQAYQFAVANPDVIEQISCYCGCGSMGHTSNYACFVSGQNVDGTLVYDSHALGCSICVDIALDTMRLLKQGKTVPKIYSYIDSTYSQYGPSNLP